MASYKHIFLEGNLNSEKYKVKPAGGGSKFLIPARDRVVQSQKLLNQFAEIWQQKETTDET